MSAAEVVDGRCAHCGGRPLSWSPQQILAAIVAWNDRFGTPPRAKQWRNASPVNPAEASVRRAFGSWTKAIRAAGLKPHKVGTPIIWTREKIENAFLDWLLAHGEWPRYRQWQHATDRHPQAQTVTREFGSWDAAKRSAGWTGVTPELVAA